MSEQITFKGATPTNTQKPNYEGSSASGARGKQKPVVNTEVEKGEQNDS
ncbi:hypothetical protein [Acetobacter tropicalis]|nr:hypothetical protein [Acetobacter tropicalis]